ncbi:MAG TPA: archaellin/type IV pilin N-terminal domain-containing protein [Candidatus Thermoplasmatota archaeon]|nr:archaellin/type IV pilin N-terminal domain-containing protein [Candidatus Thermoplasmatota archaeon]
MKACRKALERNDRAEVGIGTMIVFIATVLVAAIAASVLIDTSGKLQERSTRTGQETTQQVASNLQVNSITGKRASLSEANMTMMNITLSVAPGAQSIDLSQLMIQMNTGQRVTVLGWTSGTESQGKFNTTALRDADGSFTFLNPVINAGDLVVVNINLTADSLQLSARKPMEILLVPEIGTHVRADFIAPASYGTNLVVTLR